MCRTYLEMPFKMEAVSFGYWNDCVDPDDLEAMWTESDVKSEWISVGETKGSRVHLSRDSDNQPCLTQTEMRAVAGIVVQRHFVSQIDMDMLCTIAEIESGRQILAKSYNKKPDEVNMGIMQISPKIAEWFIRESGYRSYNVAEDSKSLYKPFLNVYIAAAYLKWLSNFDNKNFFGVGPAPDAQSRHGGGVPQSKGPIHATWDSRTSPEDMALMWNNPNVKKEWKKSGEKKGKVRFSHDVEKHPYLSRVELRAILCALCEMISMRFINGVGQHTGLMGVDYPTARWLYDGMGYKAYSVEAVEDLTKPFVSMYFGAAYMAWLSEYEGRERSLAFVAQAYLCGPRNVSLQETGPLRDKFEEILSRYEKYSRDSSSGCTIM
ncbi:hypothetical protein SASPL_130293 [Salvia splendens]|uniref:Transglycosylase SLT domain-containing protein n=1 Tax=Salvia splendens TaxID=180675 RepID=A0A8X8ZJS4_SALSN|nr:hypothetical protein SASPL_130293 [Salvia splendens]